MPGKSDNLKLALPIVIQLLVIIGGGIALFYQTSSSHETALQETKVEIIRKVDKTEDKVEDVQEDVDELQLEQKVMKKEILEAVDQGEDLREMKHKLDCHASKGARCKSP